MMSIEQRASGTCPLLLLPRLLATRCCCRCRSSLVANARQRSSCARLRRLCTCWLPSSLGVRPALPLLPPFLHSSSLAYTLLPHRHRVYPRRSLPSSCPARLPACLLLPPSSSLRTARLRGTGVCAGPREGARHLLASGGLPAPAHSPARELLSLTHSLGSFVCLPACACCSASFFPCSPSLTFPRPPCGPRRIRPAAICALLLLLVRPASKELACSPGRYLI